jgi:hypothetical protein
LDVKAADWDATAAVRAGYERALSRRAVTRRRRWAASTVGALALAAALAFFVRGHMRPVVPVEDELGYFDDADPDALIDDLTPAQLDRVAEVLKKGA